MACIPLQHKSLCHFYLDCTFKNTTFLLFCHKLIHLTLSVFTSFSHFKTCHSNFHYSLNSWKFLFIPRRFSSLFLWAERKTLFNVTVSFSKCYIWLFCVYLLAAATFTNVHLKSFLWVKLTIKQLPFISRTNSFKRKI